MKKALSILLVLLLALSILPGGALAADVVLSPQNLRVDGKRIECEKYNIDGSNYFKLRDIAMLLRGTGSSFSVSWDGGKKLISLVSGEEYEPNGSELDLSGGDKSASAVPGTATLLINGEERSDLSAYNLEGNNFFKLRDLGDALGFKVDYDQSTNTAIVISRAMAYPTPWRTVETDYSNNNGGTRHSVETYDEDGRLLRNYTNYGGYEETTECAYNELGFKVSEHYEYRSEYEGDLWEDHSDTVYEYDKWGQLVKAVTTSENNQDEEPFVYTESRVYDDNGLLVSNTFDSIYNHSVYTYYYDERGFLIKDVSDYNGAESYTTEYVRDEEGRALKTANYGPDGYLIYSYEFEYEGDLLTKETYTNGDYSSVTVSTYNEAGNLLRRETSGTENTSFTENSYDEEGQMVESVYYDGCDTFTSLYAYDEAGNLIRNEHDAPDGSYVYEYTYDAEGNLLTESYSGSDYVSVTTYAYDAAAGKQSITTVVTYPPAEAISISSETLTMAVGDTYYLYHQFTPYSCAEETVSWTSSDPAVAEVDDSGCVTAVGAGSALITVTSESGLTAACELTVTAEKYKLTLSSTDLVLSVGDTVPLHCTTECVGNYVSYKLRYERKDQNFVELRWGEWDGYEIDLNVTGAEPGTGAIEVSVISSDGETIYTTVTVNITVKRTDADVTLKQELPYTYNHLDADGQSEFCITVTDFRFSFGTDGLTLFFTGEKTYDAAAAEGDEAGNTGEAKLNAHRLDFRIIDAEGYVVAMGSVDTPKLGVGEKFRDISAFVAVTQPGEYYLEFTP